MKIYRFRVRRLFYDILTAHIHSERLGDAHGAVFIEIVLKESYEHSRRSNDGVIKSMCKIVAVFALNPYAESSCLGVAEV